MDTTLIFVRHGESEANGKGFFAGQVDIGLSPRGKQQAEMTAQYIWEHYSVDMVYSSDLQRAYHTALPIAEICDTEVVKSEQLREIFAGQWQGCCFDELQSRFSDTYGVWLTDIGNARPDGGETVEHLFHRIWSEVQRIAQKSPGKTVVIVTHATPIRAFLCRLHGYNLAQMKDIPWVSNASCSIVQVDGDQWKLLQANVDEHLAHLRTHFPANV